MSEINEIVIDDGKKTYTIKNMDGEVVGRFRFNPTDINIRKRYSLVVSELENIGNRLSEIEDDNIDDVLDRAEEDIKAQIDFLFDSNVSSEFFSITSPFSIMANGEYFFVNVIDCIAKIVESETGERMKKLKAKVSKYTKKYHG